MSILGFNNFWGIDASNQAAPVFKMNDAGFTDKFLADVGAKQEIVGMKNAIAALDKPDVEVDKVEAAFKKEVGLILPIIKNDYDMLTNNGVPDSLAEEYALDKGKEMFAASKKLLARIHPLAIQQPDVLLSKAAGVDLRTRQSKGKAPRIVK